MATVAPPPAPRAAAGRAVMWSGIDVVGRNLLSFVVSIALARLLMPADFGAIAIAAIPPLIGGALYAVMTTALVQRRDLSRAEENAAFWTMLLVSLALVALFGALAPVIARFYDLPILRGLIWLGLLHIPFTALGAVHSARLARKLRFKPVAAIGLAATIVAGAVAIALAATGWRIWALGVQLVLTALLTSLLQWVVEPWRPGLRWRLADIHPLWVFGRWLTVSNLLDIGYAQGAALSMGKLFGPRDLGLYARANNVQQLPPTIVNQIVSRVSLPFFAARQDDLPALADGLNRANAVAMLINAPALFGLAAVSPVLIETLFGAKWLDAAPALSVLALSGVAFPLQALNGQAILATGRSDRALKLEMGKKTVGILFLLAGSLFGLMGLAASQLLFSFIALALTLHAAHEVVGLSPRAQLKATAGALVAGAAAGAAAFAVVHLLDRPAPVEVLLGIAAGGLAYIVAIKLMRLEAVREFDRQIGPHLPRLLQAPTRWLAG